MHYTNIVDIKNLEKIVTSSIFISGDSRFLNEEIEHNMWALTFDEFLIQKMQESELEVFISQLLQKKSKQLSNINPNLSAIFYLWFDIQALQLRFNLISKTQSDLPFRCKLNKLTSPKSILQNFLTTALRIAQEGMAIEYFDAKEDDENDNEEKIILDVYIETLPLSKHWKIPSTIR